MKLVFLSFILIISFYFYSCIPHSYCNHNPHFNSYLDSLDLKLDAYNSFIKAKKELDLGNKEKALDLMLLTIRFDSLANFPRLLLAKQYSENKEFLKSYKQLDTVFQTDTTKELLSFFANIASRCDSMNRSYELYNILEQTNDISLNDSYVYATILEWKGFHKRALEQYKIVNKYFTGNSYINSRLFLLHFQFKEYNNALSVLKNDLPNFKVNGKFLKNMENLYDSSNVEIKKEVLSIYDSLAFAYPKKTSLLFSYLSFLYQREKSIEVSNVFEKISKIPEFPIEVLKASIAFYDEIGKHKEADSLIIDLFNIDSSLNLDKELLSRQAMLKLKLNYDSLAIFLAKKVLELDSLDSETWGLLQLILINSGKNLEVINNYNAIKQKVPEYSIREYWQALAYKNLSQADSAIYYYKIATNKNKDNISMLFEFASTLERDSQFVEAENVFRIIIEKDPLNDLALNYLGYMLADLDSKLSEAATFIERALAIDGTNISYMDSYAWVLYKLKRYKDAQRFIEIAFETVKNDPVIYEHAIAIYKAQNNLLRVRELKLILKSIETNENKKQ